MSSMGTYWPPPSEYLLTEYEKRVKKLPTVAELKDTIEKVLEEERNALLAPYRANKVRNALKQLCIHAPEAANVPMYIGLIASDDKKTSRLAHHLVRECAPLSEENYKALVEVLDAEVKVKSPIRRSVALRTLTKVLKKKDFKRGINTADVSLRSISGIIKDIRKAQGLPARAPKDDKGEKGKKKKKKDEPGSSDEEELVDDGAGNMIHARDVAPKIVLKSGKIVMGHAVMSCLRRCNRLNATQFVVETYFIDLGIKAATPSTVRNTVCLLEERLVVNPSAVGLYLHPRLPQFKPSGDKKLVFEDLGARVAYARILASLATDPKLESLVTRNEELADRGEKRGGIFKFLFGGGADAQTGPLGAFKSLKDTNNLGVDFLEALLILLRNPSARVLLEIIIGLSRRHWSSWIDVPVPTLALHNAPDYDEAKLAGEVDLGDGEDGDDSDEEFLKGDKLGRTPNSELATPAMGEAPAGSARAEKRRKERQQHLEANTPFYLRQVGEGMVPALEVVLRRILGGVLSDEPCKRFGALRAAVAIARAKIYTDTREQQEMFEKARSVLYSTQGTVAGAAGPAPPGPQGTQGPQGPPGPQGQQPPQEQQPHNGPTFEDDSQQHVLEPLTKQLRQLVEDEPSLYVRCKAAEALLLFIAAGAGSSLEDPFEDELLDDANVPRPMPPGGSSADPNRARLPDGSMPPQQQPPPPPPPKPARPPLLVRIFAPFVCNDRMRGLVAFEALKPMLESLAFEVKDVAPAMAGDVVRLVEEFALYHGSKGFCSYLYDTWESVLSLADERSAAAVAASVRRCVTALPQRERVAGTAAQFLRRRVLDLAVLGAGATDLVRQGVPTPLPQGIGTEVEKYFSLLYYGVLLGPSAESRQNFLEALGGAAVLAGDPFRITTYEKLCEFCHARGLGLRPTTEFILTAMDTLYYAKERLAQARLRMEEQGGIVSVDRERIWLEGVWKLAAEASAAAASLLASPPPPGWQPLGADAAVDVKAAEEAFGDFRVGRPTEPPLGGNHQAGAGPPPQYDDALGPPPGYDGRGPPPGYDGRGPPPGYDGRGPPPGYDGRGPPPGYDGRGPPPGYDGRGPPQGYDGRGPPPGAPLALPPPGYDDRGPRQ